MKTCEGAVTIALLTTGCLLGQQSSQESTTPAFRAQTGLVLVPFHVGRDKYYVSDLKRSDVVLLEDGTPRDFSIFEGPATENRTLQLVLLFDTSRGPQRLFNLDVEYDFTQHWDEEMSRTILERGKANVQASVYRVEGKRAQRLCRPTTDPRELLGAFQRLPTPMSDLDLIPLAVPVKREDRVPEQPLWPLEAIIGVLKDSTTPPDHIARSMVIFSNGNFHSTTRPGDVADQAVALGIPIYSVIFNANFSGVHKSDGTALEAEAGRQLMGMPQLRKVAELTGGSYFDVLSIDAGRLRDILEAVKNEGLSQYVLGFNLPASSASTRGHKLEIRLVSKSSGKLMGGKREAIY